MAIHSLKHRSKKRTLPLKKASKKQALNISKKTITLYTFAMEKNMNKITIAGQISIKYSVYLFKTGVY